MARSWALLCLFPPAPRTSQVNHLMRWGRRRGMVILVGHSCDRSKGGWGWAGPGHGSCRGPYACAVSAFTLILVVVAIIWAAAEDNDAGGRTTHGCGQAD